MNAAPPAEPTPASPLPLKGTPAATREAAWFRVRFAIYFGLVAALFQGIVLLIPRISYDAVVPESHVIELSQVALLALTALGFLILACQQRRTRELYIVLFTLALFAILREHNNTVIYQDILHEKWKKWVLALVVLAVLGFTLGRNLITETRQFLLRRSISLFIAGAVIVIAWAQVLSSNRIWEKSADRLVEEALELAGYFLILTGVIEEHLATRRAKAAASSDAPVG